MDYDRYVYIVDYWVPFPTSEYGGLLIYVAETDDQAVNMIIEDTSDYRKERYPDFEERIRSCVEEAEKIPAAEGANFGYVDGFVT